ncbi:chromate efflux transporter [Bdellovibrio svalbardensis]|uniref:Chromate efflux transporter n=1 Tax=Bdellovibrio svalbardensis TaxID=2972972 RepID=A0ABT6DG20_9BACT|nr:chromate efflux transporter [Bdellovibrio svalbardensis]MDG0815766.1 chromate efflux transporter [Bdellovibrio svalbardensis]
MKLLEIFLIFLRLGLTSFGGPIAHLGYFHNEFVNRRKWIHEEAYAELVAICQFLPGPASSQVGMAIGLNRAGLLGAIVAWIGFTLPSAILLVLFAFGISHFSGSLDSGWLHSLKVIAVAVVAQAIWAMGTKLCPDKERLGIALLACAATSAFPSAWIQLITLAVAGILAAFFFKKSTALPHTPMPAVLSKKVGATLLTLFFSLLVLLPMAAKFSQAQGLKLFESFYRAGSLVFGGGHVVLPLLQSEVVPTGWVSDSAFMAGYGAAQAIPGPLFSFSAYLGAISNVPPNGWLGALICLLAAFLPAFLLILGTLPFWEQLRKIEKMRLAMLGINAAVVGLLLSAFIHPVWSSGILNLKDFLLALSAFLLLTLAKAPSWLVVLLGVLAGLVIPGY